MNVYNEAQVREAGTLQKIWRAEESFVLLAGKLELSFLPGYLAQIPAEYERGHFALLTSGSTGRPKLILGAKRRTAALARLLHSVQQSEAVTAAVLALPISYSYAFVNQVVWSIEMERRLRITGGVAAPNELAAALEEESNSMLCLVGAQLPLLFAAFGEKQFPRVTRIHFAGGRFPQERLTRLAQTFPNARVFNNYGCAEAMPRLTVRPAEQYTEGAIVGAPLPGIEMKLGEESALLFRSPYRAVAIVDETGFRAIADEEWLPSGDRAEQIAGGSWRLLGRNNEVFKRFGEKISLSALLQEIRAQWPGEAAFYTETDKYSELAHVLVLSPAPAPAQVTAILQALRKTHPRPHWPVRIESLPALPLSVNNKVDTQALAAESPEKVVEWRLRY